MKIDLDIQYIPCKAWQPGYCGAAISAEVGGGGAHCLFRKANLDPQILP